MGLQTQSVSDLVAGAIQKMAARVKQSLKPGSDPADGDSSDFDDPAALVCAAVRPRPYSGAGAIALTEADDHYPMV